MRSAMIKVKLGLNPDFDEPYVSDAEMEDLGCYKKVAETIVVRALDRAERAPGLLADGPRRYAETIKKKVSNAR